MNSVSEEEFLIFLLNQKRYPRAISSLTTNAKMDNTTSEITKMLKSPPSSWRKMFLQEGISETPTISQVLSLLDETAGSNISLERDTSSNNPKNFVPPESVRKEAMKGIRLSYENNYPSYKGIGLARAVQLATQPTIWLTSAERMNAFFKRNQRFESLGSDSNPTKSYLAWLNWGGSSGRDWVNKILK